jgi:hypothetical protein
MKQELICKNTVYFVQIQGIDSKILVQIRGIKCSFIVQIRGIDAN